MSAAYRLRGTLEALDAQTALLWEAGCRGLVQEGEDVVAYFAAPVELPLPGRWEEVPDTDWLAAYHEGLEPVVLPGLVVAPTHQVVRPEPGQLVLRLDPGMAFGTGHHETTRLALRALASFDLAGKDVLDVGAGSGILAIAASLFGAAAVLGLDTDPETVPVAEQNRDLNRARAVFRAAGLDDRVSDASADVLVANLYAELHALLATQYHRVLRPGGTLLATGIAGERLKVAKDAIGGRFEALELEQEGDWWLVRARRP